MSTNDVTVQTPGGRLRGELNAGTLTFLSVPYAAAPLGPARFCPPGQVAPWVGLRDASQAGPCAPHRVTPFAALDVAALVGTGGASGGDYLTCNIWAPEGGSDLPVMVWIHGGGFIAGSKDAPVQRGENFARSGVVCVAINYRMGIDGFLPIPGIPTNLGLRDMLAALAWVRDSIAAFGGNPDNVTVFGESAGAMAIADLITSPLAKGLFHRAIIQSGHGAMVRTVEVAQRVVHRLAMELGIAPTRDGFAEASTEAVFDAIERISKPNAKLDLRDEQGYEPVFGISRFIPVFGDDVLPVHPLEALESGIGADIDVLIGTNSEEMNLYWVPTGVKRKLDSWLGRVVGSFIARKVFAMSHADARGILAAYGLGKRGQSAGDVFCRATSDFVFRWPARRYAENHRGRTHMYEFDWRSPACDGALGACHALEVPFVFNALETATGERGFAGQAPPQGLAHRVHRIWVDFATDGKLPWPEFNAKTRQVFQIARNEPIFEPPMPVAPFLR